MVQRILWKSALGLLAALCVAGNVCGQIYPSRPVGITILPAAAGGALDALSRIYGQKMSESWGQPDIVEYRAGASGNIAAIIVAKAAPDGHTYLFISQSLGVNLHLKSDLPYYPLRDFAPVMLVGTTDGVLLVPPALAVISVQD